MTATLIQFRHASLSIEDGVAEFTHQRPEARNALSLQLRTDYMEMLDAIEADRSVRALIVTGSGGSFCAGGDLKSMTEARERPETGSPHAIRRRVMDAHVWMHRLRNLEVPVIAAVDGAAVGAGFSLALAADFVLASSRSYFCMSFAKVGLVPDLGAAYFLPRVIGMAAAKELVLTGRKLGVEEAKQLGIVHTIHSPATLADDARSFARRFVVGPREALGLGKRLLNQSFESSYVPLAELESAAQAVASSVSWHSEAVSAFLEGKPALYDWDRLARE
jgi:enoyl-CoA hydratase/carnithine racemase